MDKSNPSSMASSSTIARSMSPRVTAWSMSTVPRGSSSPTTYTLYTLSETSASMERCGRLPPPGCPGSVWVEVPRFLCEGPAPIVARRASWPPLLPARSEAWDGISAAAAEPGTSPSPFLLRRSSCVRWRALSREGARPITGDSSGRERPCLRRRRSDHHALSRSKPPWVSVI